MTQVEISNLILSAYAKAEEIAERLYDDYFDGDDIYEEVKKAKKIFWYTRSLDDNDFLTVSQIDSASNCLMTTAGLYDNIPVNPLLDIDFSSFDTLIVSSGESVVQNTYVVVGVSPISISTSQNGNVITYTVSLDSSSNVTASNGLNKLSNDIKLGGDLTQDTNINADNHKLGLYSGNSQITGLEVSSSPEFIKMKAGGGEAALAELFPSGEFNINSSDLNVVSTGPIDIQNDDFSISFSASGLIISDSLNSRGAEYPIDYSASYTDRTLPDVGWVSSHIGGQPVSSTIQSPGVAEDTKVISWNDTNQEYELVSNAGGSGATALNDLTDVSITTPSSPNVLKYNGAEWVNSNLFWVDVQGKPTFATVAITGDYNDLINTPTATDELANLIDVTITSPVDGQSLIYNSGSGDWINAYVDYTNISNTPNLATVATTGDYNDLINKPTIPLTLVDLQDTSISSPISPEVLRFNGTTWSNSLIDYSELTGTPTIPTAGNGITNNSGSFQLGDSDTDGWIWQFDVSSYFDVNWNDSTNARSLDYYIEDILGTSNSRFNTTLSSLLLSNTTPSGTSSVDISQNKITITPDNLLEIDGNTLNSFQGATYAEDYSADFVNNSLISKLYDDTHIGGQNVSSLITTPTATEDNYVIVWDNTGSQYDLVEASFGTSATGIVKEHTFSASTNGQTDFVIPGAVANEINGVIVLLTDGNDQWDNYTIETTSVTNDTIRFNEGLPSGVIVHLRYSKLNNLTAINLDDLLDVNVPTPSEGDIIYFNGSEWVNLGKGTDGQVLTSTPTTINWEDAIGGGSTISGTANVIPKFNAAGDNIDDSIISQSTDRIIIKSSDSYLRLDTNSGSGESSNIEFYRGSGVDQIANIGYDSTTLDFSISNFKDSDLKLINGGSSISIGQTPSNIEITSASDTNLNSDTYIKSTFYYYGVSAPVSQKQLIINTDRSISYTDLVNSPYDIVSPDNALYKYNSNVIDGGSSSSFISNGYSNQITNTGNASSIIGGTSNLIDGAQFSAIIGGASITLSQWYTVSMPKVRVGLGSGGSLTTGSTSRDFIVRNSTNGELETRDVHDVAISGDYNDLINTPSFNDTLSSLTDTTITSPTNNQYLRYNGSVWINDNVDYSHISNTPSLSTVATTGDYNDLINTPNLATVATTGNYNDLTNKPTIPSVLNELGDVVLSSPSNGSILVYDGANWVNDNTPFDGNFWLTDASFSLSSSIAVTSTSSSFDLIFDNNNRFSVTTSDGSAIHVGQGNLNGGIVVRSPYVSGSPADYAGIEFAVSGPSNDGMFFYNVPTNHYDMGYNSGGGTLSLARVKGADPTEDDDFTTRSYVDDNFNDKILFVQGLSLTDGSPTEAEIESVLGAANTHQAGFMEWLKDTNGTANSYLVVSDALNWFYAEFEQAV